MNRLLSVLAFLAIGLISIHGQTTTATITGVATDETGAILPGVDILIVNEGTGLTRTTITNEAGNYAAPLLPIGSYRVEAQLPGFRKEIRRGITLQLDQRARVDFVLQLGQVDQIVDVTSEAPLVQTEDSSVGSVIDQHKMAELPLNGRNFEGLVQLVPGAVTAHAGSHLSARGGFVVAGMDEHYQSFFIDGYDNVDTVIRNFAYRPSVDSIAEFKVQSSGYNAEFGRNAGAVINVTTKSGTNEFHGSMWEFHRNSAMDAKNFFSPANEKIPGFLRNQFGATAGGPIKRDKTFYFVTYEGLRERRAVTRRGRVPSLAFRSGDFSSLGRQIIDPMTGQPFPGNVIPRSRFDPLAVEVTSFWPQPNQTGTLNLLTSPSNISNFSNISVKIDQKLSTAHQLSGRWSYANEFIDDPFASETGTGNNMPVFGQWVPRYRTNLGLTLTSVISNRMVNEFRPSYNRFIQPQSPYHSDLARLVGREQIPLPSVMASIPRGRNAFDTFNLSSAYENLGGGGGFNRNTQFFAFVNNLSITSGNHSFKIGGDLRRMRFDNITGGPNSYQFDGRYTGDTFADFLLGLPLQTTTSVGARSGVRPRELGMERKFEWAAYIQDDWKVTPRLVVNWGIRYEYYRPITSANGMSGWDKDTNRIQVLCDKDFEAECGQPLDPALYILQIEGNGPYPVGLHEPDRNNFAPRLGIAYRPFQGDQTVIRGSYGIFYDSDDRTKSGSTKGAPFLTSMTFTSDPRIPQIQLASNTFPAALGRQPTLGPGAYDRKTRDTYAQRWNLGVQHEVASGLLVDVEYQGSLTVKGRRSRQINQPLTPGPGNANLRRPYVQFAGISYTENSGNANFHSLQSKIEKRFARGLTFITSFMWGKAIDDRYLSGDGAGGAQDSYDLKNERALSAFDIRRKLSVSYVWELPFGPGRTYLQSGAGAMILGGWQLSGIFTTQSGMPFTPGFSGDNSNVGNRNDRPNLIRDPRLSDRSPDRWFDASAYCFTASCGFAPFTYGNAGRNTLVSDGINNIDFSLTKNNRFGQDERYNVQFRAEFFNLANHPNFGIPARFVNLPTAGRVSSTTTSSRQIQLGLRLVF